MTATVAAVHAPPELSVIVSPTVHCGALRYSVLLQAVLAVLASWYSPFAMSWGGLYGVTDHVCSPLPVESHQRIRSDQIGAKYRLAPAPNSKQSCIALCSIAVSVHHDQSPAKLLAKTTPLLSSRYAHLLVKCLSARVIILLLLCKQALLARK